MGVLLQTIYPAPTGIPKTGSDAVSKYEYLHKIILTEDFSGE
jgi:hypothetical protein